MSSESGPIFIGGLSGSGKTQLRVVLGAHPELSMTRRTYLWSRYYGRFGTLASDENVDRCFAALAADRDVQQLHPDWDRLRAEIHDGRGGYARLFSLMHEQHAEQEGKRRWGDQLRDVECFADVIFAECENARMIHMVRHPASARTSRRKVGFDTAMWLHSATTANTNRLRHPANYRVVHYEALVSNPTETVRAICAFIDEQFTDSMEEAIAQLCFDDEENESNNDPRVDSFIDLYTRRAAAELGYPRETQPLRELVSQAIPIWPANRARMAAWRMVRGGPLDKQAKS
jgi:hypothetical protein